MPSALVLREATLADEPAVLAAHRATSPEYPSFLHFYDEDLPFDRYLDVLADARGGRLRGTDDFVPETFLFAFAEGRVVGRAALRHRLTPPLEREGGHIGYVVVPACRRRGHATEILRQALGIARHSLGLRRVLVTCDATNAGSIRTIEKNGGVLDDVVDGPDLDVPVRRYWIDLP
jgi:predicted acetyltransferase